MKNILSMPFLCVLACCAADTVDIEDAAKPKSQALSLEHQCLEDEREDWDGRLSACTGPWAYKTYDCYQAKQSAACGIDDYESKAIVGEFTCENARHGIARWKKVLTTNRLITWVQLTDYQNELAHEAEHMFGLGTIGVYEVVGTDLGEIWACLPPNSREVKNEITYTEVYYHRTEDGDFAEQAHYVKQMTPGDFPFRQTIVMTTAKENLVEGFATAQFNSRIYPAFWSHCANRFVTVVEQYFKPSRYVAKQSSICGTGVIGHEPDYSRPIYASCRHPSHGRAENNACQAPETMHRSALNLRRDELPAEHRYVTDQAQCSTADALDESATVSARLMAFGHVAAGKQGDGVGRLAPDVDTETIRRLALRKLKWQFERSDAPVAEHLRIMLRDAYASAPAVNACGTSGVGPGDAALSSELYGLLAMCHRLSLEHTSANAIDQSVALCALPCLDAKSASSSRREMQRLAEHHWTMIFHFIAHLRGAEDGRCRDTDVAKASRLILEWGDTAHAWYDPEVSFERQTSLAKHLATQCIGEEL